MMIKPESELDWIRNLQDGDKFHLEGMEIIYMKTIVANSSEEDCFARNIKTGKVTRFPWFQRARKIVGDLGIKEGIV